MKTITHNIEQPKEVTDIVLLKSGFGIGGAGIADMQLLQMIHKQGIKVSVLTGFISPLFKNFFEKNNIPIIINSTLDRDSHSSAEEIKTAIEQHTNEKSLIFASQAACPDVPSLGLALSKIRNKTVIRLHDPADKKTMKNLKNNAETTMIMPITQTLQQSIPHNKLHNIIVPPLLSSERFEFQKNGEFSLLQVRKYIRENLGVSEHETILFQPTRVHQEKGITYSINLLEKFIQEKGGHPLLIISGGGGVESEYKEHLMKIIEQKKLQQNIIFLDNKTSDNAQTRSRTADYLAACDFVIFPTEVESFGLPPAEAFAMKKPLITTDYKDVDNNKVYKDIYKDFESIKIKGENYKYVIDAMVKVNTDGHNGEPNYQKVKKFIATDEIIKKMLADVETALDIVINKKSNLLP